jgi:3-oxoacyl-(acyl-carrier-protein) synthase
VVAVDGIANAGYQGIAEAHSVVQGALAIGGLLLFAASSPPQKYDLTPILGHEAAVQAHTHAGLHVGAADPAVLGIIAGTSRGPMQKWTESLDLARSARDRLPPTLAANSTLDGLSGALSMALGAGGTCLTVSATCG